MPLDPAYLTPAASLNRVPMIALAGLPVPPAARGKRAFDLLSAAAVHGAILAHADALGLAEAANGDPSDLFHAFDACFTARDPVARAAAADVAQDYGGHLAHLLLTLLRGEPAARQARPDWDDSYWAHWAAVRRVWLGGGLAGGAFGRAVQAEAAAVLAAQGAACTVALTAHPRLLPLIGAARSVPAGACTALVWDFGGTAVKRAWATYRAGTLTGLRVLPPVPSGLDQGTGQPPDAAPAALAARIADLLAAGWAAARAAGADPAPLLVASMACYLRAGQPLSGQLGAYAALNILSDNLARLLADAVSRRTGRALEVRLVHDGTAAARACAGRLAAAAITLGTALGVGFPPADDGALRPVAPEFAIQSE